MALALGTSFERSAGSNPVPVKISSLIFLPCLSGSQRSWSWSDNPDWINSANNGVFFVTKFNRGGHQLIAFVFDLSKFDSLANLFRCERVGWNGTRSVLLLIGGCFAPNSASLQIRTQETGNKSCFVSLKEGYRGYVYTSAGSKPRRDET